MMPYRSACVRSDAPAVSPASARLLPGQTGTRTSDLTGSEAETVKICMTPRRPVMQPSPSDAILGVHTSCPGPLVGRTVESVR
jgi:hypothetical protein